MQMKKLTQKELMKRIQGTWDSPVEVGDTGEIKWRNANIIANVIGGVVVHAHEADLRGGEEPEPCVLFAVIRDPEFQITSGQLCQIFDESNHCLSEGSITYESRYAYITWSNLGHI